MTRAPGLLVVERALIDAGGSVAAAARTVGMASAELRKLVRTRLVLADAVFEQIEQEIDAAQQVLLDGLESENAMTRIRAASYILRYTEAGRRRSLRSRGSSHDESAERQTVTLKWIDT